MSRAFSGGRKIERIVSPRTYVAPSSIIALVVLLALGAVWFFLPAILTQTPNQQPQVVTETHPQKANAPLGSHPPPQPGKPWTNSLEMSFLPIGDLYISEWQTRKRDFEAFVQATGYDAVGGMSSAVTQNGFKLNEMSWNSPGSGLRLRKKSWRQLARGAPGWCWRLRPCSLVS